MTCYIVSFQAKTLQVRDRLREKLREYGTFCPIDNTCWAILSDKKPAEIADNLKTVLGPEDRIFVIRSGTEAAWVRPISAKHSEWLKRNL